MQLLALICIVFVGNQLVNAENLSKDKLAKLGLQKEEKPDCLLVRSRLGCACSTCKDVISFTKMLILSHVPTEEEVLDKICFRIFGSDEKKEALCETIVKDELPEIIKYVKSRVDPKKVCAKFC